MKAIVLDKEGKEKEKIDLPSNFYSVVRKDLVQKVFEAQKRHQPYGTKIYAGSMYSASGILRRKRHAWKSSYGRGISRSPRKIMARSGSSFTWIGASAPYARGGRAAHPPRAEKNQTKKINKKELSIAINSCLSASINKEVIKENYGFDIKNLPLVVESEITKMKSKNFFDFLKKMFGDNFEKIIQKKSIRSGRGKIRGRKYKKNAGLIFIISSKEFMKRKGVDVKKVKDLNLADLTLNGKPGRMLLFTKDAIKEIGDLWKKE